MNKWINIWKVLNQDKLIKKTFSHPFSLKAKWMTMFFLWGYILKPSDNKYQYENNQKLKRKIVMIAYFYKVGKGNIC